MMILFVVIGGLTGWQFGSLPTGVLPVEDHGYVIASVQLPDAASLERTSQMLKKIDRVLEKTPRVA